MVEERGEATTPGSKHFFVFLNNSFSLKLPDFKNASVIKDAQKVNQIPSVIQKTRLL